MTALAEPPTGSILLWLGGCADGDLAALRQQLALCLATGVTQIRVDVSDLDDVEPPALQTLQGVADYLRRKGGGLTLAGAGPGVLDTLAQRRLERLLPGATPRQARTPEDAGRDRTRSVPSRSSRPTTRALPTQENAR